MADTKTVGGIAGTAALVVGLGIGVLMPKDASEEAVNMASAITGISSEALATTVKEDRAETISELPSKFVLLPIDTITGKRDSVYRATETQWTTTVNEGFWINWPDPKRMPLTTIDSYETDTGAVMIKNVFKPSDSLIDACGGIAVQRIITYRCIPLYGVKTR